MIGLCLASALGAVLLVPASLRAADPVTYDFSLAPTGNGALDAALNGSSQLAALRKNAPAGPFALVARARADIGRLKTATDSFGYYQATIKVTIDGRGLDDIGLPDALGALPAGAHAKVAVTIDKGALYHLRHVTLDGTVPPEVAAKFKLAPGDPAVAAPVLQAGSDLLTALQEEGYALAKIDPPAATEIPSEHALDVTFHVVTGPRVDLGPIAITGLKRVHERYVRRRLLLKEGQLFQPSKIEAARQDLASVGVFSGIKISAAKTLDAAGEIPLRVDVSERKRHAVTFNIAYSTDLGGSAGVTWSDRNLLGNAEQLNLTGDITGLGGSASKGVGYLAKAQFLKPDFYHRDQTFEFDVEGLKQNLDSYDQTAIIAGPVLTRKLSQQWTASIGLTGTQERILQEGVSRDYTLLAVPITGRFDNTNVATPLDDPLHGLRATLIATPTESLSGGSRTFVILQGQASTYFDFAHLGLSKPGKTVLAFHGLVGSAQGASDFQLPPDQRFYGGGSGTVRGFRYQSIGPQFADQNPVGGTAIDAGTIELRQRIWGNIGAAVFVDAGQVSTKSSPFSGKLEEGGGIGVRYYTPIGPLRVDIAVPISREPGGDSYELYLGLGQAF